MTTPTTLDRIQFIEDLDLADPAAFGVQAIERLNGGTPDYDKDAFVCLGSTVTAAPSATPGQELTEQNKADVLNSTLLAQLAATNKYDRHKEAMKWYEFYRTVLENIGWVAKKFEFKGHTMRNDNFSADEVVFEILKNLVSQDVLGLITATFSGLKDLGEGSSQVKMYEGAASGDHNGNFQAFPIYPDQLGVGMAFAGYELVTTETITRFLWFKFSSKSTKITAAAEAVQLNEQVYATVREAILAKLGKAANDFVDGIEI